MPSNLLPPRSCTSTRPPANNRIHFKPVSKGSFGSKGITEKEATKERTKYEDTSEFDGRPEVQAARRGIVTIRMAFSCTCQPKAKATAEPNLTRHEVPQHETMQTLEFLETPDWSLAQLAQLLK